MFTEEKTPFNPTTGREYTGKNFVLLATAQSLANYDSSSWAGFGQWIKSGRAVKKGERGTHIVMMKTKKIITPQGEKVETYPSSAVVFNICQTEILAK